MSRIIAVLLLFLYTSTIFAQSIPTSARLGVGMGKGSQSVLSGEQSTFFQNFDGETDGRDALANKSVDLAMSSADYMVTAGDVYTLSFAVGNTPVSYTIPVDSSYRVRVANLAVLDATGMSFVKLKRQVEDIVTKNYPLSAVQFVLLNPATFKVRLVGEVKSAVEMEAWALTRLSQVLGDSLTEYSSRRTITITSTSGKVKTCDLFLATRFGDLTAPLRDRFGIVQQLQYYNAEELAKIIKRTSKILNYPIEDDATMELARRSRGTPRIANRLFRRIRDFAQYEDLDSITVCITDYALNKLNIDSAGLDITDIKYLRCLIERFNGGPAGLEAICATIS